MNPTVPTPPDRDERFEVLSMRMMYLERLLQEIQRRLDALHPKKRGKVKQEPPAPGTPEPPGAD